MHTQHQPGPPGPSTGSRRFTIQAPCDDLGEMVASAMRRAPEVVEFAGFEPADARIPSAIELLKNTGHAVVATPRQQRKQSQ